MAKAQKNSVTKIADAKKDSTISPVTIKFKINPRLTLVGKLPHEDNYTNLIIIKSLRDRMELKKHDMDAINMRQPEGAQAPMWDASLDIGTEYILDEKDINYLTPWLKDLEQTGKLPSTLVKLYELLVLNQEVEIIE